MKFMGIYALEELECGCKIKHYRGGKTILDKSIRCEINHRSSVMYVCGVCKKSMLKKELKEHQWIHAV